MQGGVVITGRRKTPRPWETCSFTKDGIIIIIIMNNVSIILICVNRCMLAIVTCLRQTLYQPVNLLNLTDEICFAKA